MTFKEYYNLAVCNSYIEKVTGIYLMNNVRENGRVINKAITLQPIFELPLVLIEYNDNSEHQIIETGDKFMNYRDFLNYIITMYNNIIFDYNFNQYNHNFVDNTIPPSGSCI